MGDIIDVSKVNVMVVGGEVYTIEDVESFWYDKDTESFKIRTEDGCFTYVPFNMVVMLTTIPATKKDNAQIFSILDHK